MFNNGNLEITFQYELPMDDFLINYFTIKLINLSKESYFTYVISIAYESRFQVLNTKKLKQNTDVKYKGR